ncbi:GCN5 family acetyltransferase [Azospirillum thiophilum]|uniref:GCN5 family acetyltransferase n=1 Tax=Azospirillum thiophilum TaxID=528244 RepID=A0AAC8ZUQ2_9PROT|nr:GCN5 family acetyltransferase [Azospirillum thiophilum]KJR67105.1 GCN5 family acetyltransferase [Azospirillum thiophilum]
MRAYNEASLGRAYDRRDLVAAARAPDGTLKGGLVGYTNWDWLYVDLLWVDESTRGSGLGGRLLDAAEAEARARGCRWSRLYTYDFQAPGFYPKQGYEVWAEMEGYPPGHRQIWFRKALG